MKENDFDKVKRVLEKTLNSVNNSTILTDSIHDSDLLDNIKTIIEHSEDAKGVLAVVITSLVKKIVDPAQDIRNHQSSMKGGYSGRTLDTNVVTPFLKEHNFPAMSESGWLTRSLEHKSPYNMSYNGAIKPKVLKEAFLVLIDKIQMGKCDSQTVLNCLFSGLIQIRDSRKIKMAKPTELTIIDIIELIHKHFTYKYKNRGASRLPVLAIYAVYKVMKKEVDRYKNHELSPLLRHNAADSQTEKIGDVQILNEDGHIIEAIEVKHGIPITPIMIQDAFKKFRTEPIERYYLLTTDHSDTQIKELTEAIINVKKQSGCQIIVNGVESTLKYYLRLLRNPDVFIIAYAELLEEDQDILYEHREAWNIITTEH